MNEESVDLYELLGVAPDASQDDLKRAYKRRAQQLHPDKSGSDDTAREFRMVESAYRLLSDPEQRADYDESVFYGFPLEIVREAQNRTKIMLRKAVEQGSENMDILGSIEGSVRDTQRKLDMDIIQANASIKKYRKRRDRIKYIGRGRNLYIQVIEEALSGKEYEIRQLEREKDVAAAVLKIAADYINGETYERYGRRYAKQVTVENNLILSGSSTTGSW